MYTNRAINIDSFKIDTSLIVMKPFPAECANSSVWIIYGCGSVKSGQDGKT